MSTEDHTNYYINQILTRNRFRAPHNIQTDKYHRLQIQHAGKI